ncbi:anti sigma factor C-terminal domain-containing protein [Sporosarcina sp. NPDC096371]|uniref:anti sigma factor C-terminal domain-containing protein n=1 Tax=Sporosarcina sp. NPDC096371 TaxID=3364530 RepID=UPI00382E7903
MKDNHELDNFFSFENNEKNLIMEAKRKSTIRMACISGLVSLLVLTLIVVVKLQVTPWLLNKELIAQETYYDVHGANLFIGPWEESIQVIGSKATAPQYKLVDGRPVYRGEISNDSNPLEVHLSPQEYETYSYLGGKVMHFIHPEVTVNQVPDELKNIDVFQNHQVIEMGLSFDRAYTLDEVRDILPKDLPLQWAWMDAYSDEEVDSLQTSESPANHFTENEVIGFSMVDETGVTLEHPVKDFMESVRYGKNHRGPYKKDMQTLYEILTKQGEVDETTVKIIGAVVGGKKEVLQQLQNEPRVRASSIGAVVDSFK